MVSLNGGFLNRSNEVPPLGDGGDGLNDPSEKGAQQSGISPAQ